MKKEDAEKLEEGVYRIYWISGGSSVGVISIDREGRSRLQCSNWCSEVDLLSKSAEGIERVNLLSNQKGDKGELATAWKMIKDMRDQAERVNKANEGIEEWTRLDVDPPQPPSKTLMELAYGEESELIRAATNTIVAALQSDLSATQMSDRFKVSSPR